MLVLLSFGLVLVATVLLVLGLLVDSGLALIYGSIALSLVAAVVLFVAVRVSKPKEATSTAPALSLSDPAPAAAVAGAAAGGEWPAPDQGWEDSDAAWDSDEPDFPIEDYDELSVSEIVGVLGELDDDELAEVKAHEEANAGRRTILTDIDRRLGVDAAGAPAAAAEPAGQAPADKAR